MRASASLGIMLGSAAMLVPCGAAVAQVTTIPSLSATVGGAYSTNPFLSVEGEDSASVQLDVRPSVQLIEGTNEAVISANYNRADYLTNYGSNNGYGVSLSAGTRPNPRTSLGITASFDSQILGAQNGFISPISPVGTPPVVGLPSTPVGGDLGTSPVVTTPVVTTPVVTTPFDPVVNGDVGLFGLRQRRNALSAGLNGSYVPDARSTWNAGISVQRSSYPDQSDNLGEQNIFASNFRTYSANMGYTRALSERSSVGLQLSASHVEYARGFDSEIYTPRITYSRTLSERLNFSGGIGAGITRDTGGTNVIVSVDGSLCRSGDRLQGCIVGSRTPSPTGFGGVRVQNSLGANVGYRVDAVTNASLSANYVRIGGTQSDVFPDQAIGSQNYFNGDASVQRRLGRIFSAVASVSYRSAGGIGNLAPNGFAGGDVPGDVTGRLGISVFLGPNR
ncbi:hypothetical protein [Sphingomonas sp. 1P08PE]|uniref:hypothetical protein n=1 Tax=Sphingomonas sp. 1P08PE TaxID=554122 RepID=UPI0039A27CCF